MSEDPADLLPADGALSGALAALGSPLRLTILRALVRPRALGEIAIRIRDEDGSVRALARQTVKSHLDRPMERT